MSITWATISKAPAVTTVGSRLLIEFVPKSTNGTVTIASEGYTNDGVPFAMTTTTDGSASVQIPLGLDQNNSVLVWDVFETPLDRIPGRRGGPLSRQKIADVKITASSDYAALIASDVVPEVIDPPTYGANLATKADKSANLADLASPSTARTNLGLGSAATKDVGQVSGAVAAGDDGRFGARSIALQRKMLGGNIVPKTGQDWHGMWGEWDWPNWIKPQVDRAALLGYNGVRIIGGPRVIAVAQSGYPGPISQTALDNQWSQLATYCASKGLMLYPALGQIYDYDAIAGEGYQGATITNSLKTTASVLSKFNNVIGFDVLQEGDLRYGRLWKPSTAVSVGEKRTNGTRAYQCTTAGTTASSGGPTGTGTGITDGTAVWSSLGTVYTVTDALALLAALRTVTTLPLTFSTADVYPPGYGWAEGFYDTFVDQLALNPAGIDFIDVHMSHASNVTVNPAAADPDQWAKRYGKPMLTGEIGSPQDMTTAAAQARFTAAALLHNRREWVGTFFWALADQDTVATNKYGLWDNTGFVQGSSPLSTTSGQRTGLTSKIPLFRIAPVLDTYANPNLATPAQARVRRSSGVSLTGWTPSSNTSFVSDVRGVLLRSAAAGDITATIPETATDPIPVSGSKWYDFELETTAAATGRNVEFWVQWFDSSKVSISVAPTVTGADLPNALATLKAIYQSPSNAAYCKPVVRFKATGAANEDHIITGFAVREH